VAIVVLLLLILLVGKPPQPGRPGTTIDVSPQGVRAAYLLLEQTSVPVHASRRLAEGRVRWLLFPGVIGKNQPVLDRWLRDGGRLLLADDQESQVEAFGLPAHLDRRDDHTVPIPTPEDGVLHLTSQGPIWRTTRQPARTWPAGSEHPLVSIFRVGRGEIWLVHYPRFLLNNTLRDTDNAVLLVRLAEACSGPAHERIEFDEYVHGLADRPGVIELLLQPPVLWTTLAGVALLLLILWRYLPRFGEIEPPAGGRRRSKEEFLDAMAHLLERKRAYREAYRMAHEALVRDLELALQLPPETPAEQIAEIACSRVATLDRARLAGTLGRTDLPRNDAATFLRCMTELAHLRREFFYA
jgi:hypothetical protein